LASPKKGFTLWSLFNIRAEFHQRSTYSFLACGAQKRKKDSQVVSLFTLLGSMSVKAGRKYVGEIEPRTGSKIEKHVTKFCKKHLKYESSNVASSQAQ